jgi:hypothetical protein
VHYCTRVENRWTAFDWVENQNQCCFSCEVEIEFKKEALRTICSGVKKVEQTEGNCAMKSLIICTFSQKVTEYRMEKDYRRRGKIKSNKYF